MKMSCLIVVMLVPVLFLGTSGSAIPMWEYLSRGEKMSHLYSVFSKQTDNFCGASGDMCRKDLLSHGLNRLHALSDDDLDNMDPYQRGASELIWNNLASKRTTETQTQRSTDVPSFAIPSGSSGLPFGPNPLFRDTEDYNSFTTGFEDVFGNSLTNNGDNNHIRRYHDEEDSSSSILNERYEAVLGSGLGSATLEQNWLTPPAGPMVVRVKLDGSPVPEDARRPLPVDEDKEEFRLTRQRLPTLEQISTYFQTQRPQRS